MKKYTVLFSISLSIVIAISCKQQAALTTSTVIARGDSLSKATFDTLRHALMTTVTEKGLPAAVIYCNEQSLPITNYYASAGISIQRVAAQYRNANNQLDSLDKIQWRKYEQLKASGDSLLSAVVELDNAFVYYKPIRIAMSACLKCHGIPESDIDSVTVQKLQTLYPNDLATGYVLNDFRGLWKIEFSMP